MKGAALVIALCGCNQVFGVRETVHLDAFVPPDVPPDTAPSCPPVGMVPQLAPQLYQSVPQRCLDYSIGWYGRIAMAWCRRPDGLFQFHEGRIDDAMVPAKGDLISTFAFVVRAAQLAPDRLEAFVYVTDLSFTSSTITIWRRETDGAWRRGPDTNLPIASDLFAFDWLSNPTAGSPRHMLIAARTANTLIEYVEGEANLWTALPAYRPGDFGLTSLSEVRLSSDGLRLVFRGQPPANGDPHVYFAHRASIEDRFTTASPLLTIPAPPMFGGFGASMTDDCGRVYFSGLDSVFYARQL